MTLLKNSDELLKVVKKAADDAGGSIVYRFEQDGYEDVFLFERKDSGSEIMTLRDVAAMLQMTVPQVETMCEERTQRRTSDPLPFFKLHGKALRFRRSDIVSWLQRRAEAKPVRVESLKKKRGRPKRKLVQ